MTSPAQPAPTGDSAWDAFVASLDPQTIEQERCSPEAAAVERPWSVEDIRLRTRHAERVAAYENRGCGDIDLILTEQVGWETARRARQLQQKREAQIRAYARTHRKATAA